VKDEVGGWSRPCEMGDGDGGVRWKMMDGREGWRELGGEDERRRWLRRKGEQDGKAGWGKQNAVVNGSMQSQSLGLPAINLLDSKTFSVIESP
jgi:hypothetical protein